MISCSCLFLGHVSSSFLILLSPPASYQRELIRLASMNFTNETSTSTTTPFLASMNLTNETDFEDANRTIPPAFDSWTANVSHVAPVLPTATHIIRIGKVKLVGPFGPEHEQHQEITCEASKPCTVRIYGFWSEHAKTGDFGYLVLGGGRIPMSHIDHEGGSNSTFYKVITQASGYSLAGSGATVATSGGGIMGGKNSSTYSGEVAVPYSGAASASGEEESSDEDYVEFSTDPLNLVVLYDHPVRWCGVSPYGMVVQREQACLLVGRLNVQGVELVKPFVRGGNGLTLIKGSVSDHFQIIFEKCFRCSTLQYVVRPATLCITTAKCNAAGRMSNDTRIFSHNRKVSSGSPAVVGKRSENCLERFFLSRRSPFVYRSSGTTTTVLQPQLDGTTVAVEVDVPAPLKENTIPTLRINSTKPAMFNILDHNSTEGSRLLIVNPTTRAIEGASRRLQLPRWVRVGVDHFL